MEVYARHASLYDIAFSWDVTGEAAWLRDRLGPAARSVLETGCGSARLLVEFARLGLDTAGVDLSDEMLARAERRFADAGVAPPRLARADMSDFQLDRPFDGAFCAVGTFGYLLSDAQALEHLRCVARHLSPGAPYLVQMELRPVAPFLHIVANHSNTWEAESGGVRLRSSWTGAGWDAKRRIETIRARFEVLTGPDAGNVVDEAHPQRVWDWASWSALVAASPFEQTAAWDARTERRTQSPVGPHLEGMPLVWHELRAAG